MSKLRRVVLVRHGETVGNSSVRFNSPSLVSSSSPSVLRSSLPTGISLGVPFGSAFLSAE